MAETNDPNGTPSGAPSTWAVAPTEAPPPEALAEDAAGAVAPPPLASPPPMPGPAETPAVPASAMPEALAPAMPEAPVTAEPAASAAPVAVASAAPSAPALVGATPPAVPVGAVDPFRTRADLSKLSASVEALRAEVGKLIVGQRALVDELIAALLAGGHVLIEGVPGVAKTLTAKLLARATGLDYRRIQFTPDLMPSDVIGTSIYRPDGGQFEFHRGPIFAQIVLIDEINRAPAKTQAALFEAMEERQVTVDGTTYPLAPPFQVLATQNPIEHEGTYRLPEAQLDRFLFKVRVGYPGLEDEVEILRRSQQQGGVLDTTLVTSVLTPQDVRDAQAAVRTVRVEEPVLRYAARIVAATRDHPALYLGASPRASLALLTGAKAVAAMSGRDFATPEDVRAIVAPALRHRVVLTPEKEVEGVRPGAVLRRIVEEVEVPR